MIPKVVSWKKDTVSDLHDLLTSGETIAVIDIHGVPASAMFGRLGLALALFGKTGRCRPHILRVHSHTRLIWQTGPSFRCARWRA